MVACILRAVEWGGDHWGCKGGGGSRNLNRCVRVVGVWGAVGHSVVSGGMGRVARFCTGIYSSEEIVANHSGDSGLGRGLDGIEGRCCVIVTIRLWWRR